MAMIKLPSSLSLSLFDVGTLGSVMMRLGRALRYLKGLDSGDTFMYSSTKCKVVFIKGCKQNILWSAKQMHSVPITSTNLVRALAFIVFVQTEVLQVSCMKDM